MSAPGAGKTYRLGRIFAGDGRTVILPVDHGTMLGRVTGTLALHADDPKLRMVWEEIERRRPVSDDDAEEWIAAFLRDRGYLVK